MSELQLHARDQALPAVRLNLGTLDGLATGVSPLRGRLAASLWSACLWATIFLMWICSRPYRGVRHDATLYGAQILHRADPSLFATDVFFRHGSQDRFSIFSTLMAPLVRRFGFTVPEVAVMSLCHASLLLVVARLLTALGLRAWRWPVLLVLACLPHVYGAMGGLAFAEAFLTARTLAEPFALAALVCLLERRWVLAGLASLLAVACHPLIALPILVVGWVALALEDRRWLWLALVPLVFPLLGFAGLAPFDATLQRYDDVWWKMVLQHNTLASLLHWSLPDLWMLLTDAAILGCAWHLAGNAMQRRLWLATLVATAGLVVVSLVGVDLLRNVFITELQTWRVLWWSHLATLMAVPSVLGTLWRGNAVSRVSAASLVVALLAAGMGWQTSWVFLLVWAIAFAARGTTFVLSTSLYRLLLAVMVLAVLTLSLLELRANIRSPYDGLGVGEQAWYRFAIAVPVIGLALGALALWLQARFPRGAGVVVVAAMFAFALGQWDQRSEWNRFLESNHSPSAAPFAGLVPPDAEVFWDDDLQAAWFGLHRNSFYSIEQGGGVLFYRATAVDYERRVFATAPYDTQKQLCGLISTVDSSAGTFEGCKPTRATVKSLCAAAPGKLYLVFHFPLDSGLVSRWTFVAPRSGERTDYYLHDCSRIEAATP